MQVKELRSEIMNAPWYVYQEQWRMCNYRESILSQQSQQQLTSATSDTYVEIQRCRQEKEKLIQFMAQKPQDLSASEKRLDAEIQVL